MKWYSVKKHIPVNNSRCLIFSCCGNTWVGSYDGEEFISDEDNFPISGVTHFAIIEPVEIEE